LKEKREMHNGGRGKNQSGKKGRGGHVYGWEGPSKGLRVKGGEQGKREAVDGREKTQRTAGGGKKTEISQGERVGLFGETKWRVRKKITEKDTK